MATAEKRQKTRARFRLGSYTLWLNGIFNATVHALARVVPGGKDLRPLLHRLRGVKISSNVYIGDDVYIDGDHPASVEIHDDVVIAPRCTIIAHTGPGKPGKVVIQKRAAIAAGCLIICGYGKTLTVGEGAVISAGTTILNDVPPHTLCGAPRVKVYGSVAVPWHEAGTFEEFRRGLQPARMLGTKRTVKSETSDASVASGAKSYAMPDKSEH